MSVDQESPKIRLLINNVSELEALHDTIYERLNDPTKSGIRQLLNLNNRSFNKALYPNLHLYGVKDPAGLMTTIDSLLELHSKECYIIGYLDCLKKDELIGKKVRPYNSDNGLINST
ncbi:MAG: hypothetical protein M0Z31_10790 [Clostridia bacterium]|nr:hypothetical protein [Clostridia bacterium]